MNWKPTLLTTVEQKPIPLNQKHFASKSVEPLTFQKDEIA